MSPPTGKSFGWLLALLLLMAFAFQGSRGLWEPDEGRYSSAAINMLRSGDWMVPTIDGEHPHLTKPPLTYWALAASFRAFGANEWAARLPAALAFVGTGLCVFGIGRRLCRAQPALPAVVWSLSLAPVMTANIVSTDALLMLFEASAMFAFVEGWSRPPDRSRPWLRLMWVAWGLAFLTKGPPGMLPLLGMGVFLAARGRRRLRELADPVGLVSFALIAVTWFVLVIRQDLGRLQYFLGYEVVDRVFTATHMRNAEWYGGLVAYLPVLMVGALPWSAMAVAAAGGPRATWAKVMSRVRERHDEWLLLLCWFFVPFAIFMLARSRLPLYIVPLFVPLALMLARPLAGWRWLTSRRLVVTAAATAAVLLAGKGVVANAHTDRDSRTMAAAIAKSIDPASFDGIAFVDMRPFYGLNVYLDRPTKAVPTDSGSPSSTAYGPGEDLCTEIARPRRTLFAVKAKAAPQFLAAVARCGGAASAEIGRFKAEGNRIALFRASRPWPPAGG